MPFLLWMLKFPDLAPFSIKETSLLPCRGSRHGSCFPLWGPLLSPSFYTASSAQASVHDLGHGEWLCLASSTAPMSDLPEVPQRASLEIEELDFISKFPHRNIWRVYFTISTFLQGLCTGERNVVCTNAGAWYCAWEQQRWSTLWFFLSHSIQSFQATTTTTTPPSWDLGHVALIGSILYLCGLKPHDSLVL